MLTKIADHLEVILTKIEQFNKTIEDIHDNSVVDIRTRTIIFMYARNDKNITCGGRLVWRMVDHTGYVGWVVHFVFH